jgi:hypothetical protein
MRRARKQHSSVWQASCSPRHGRLPGICHCVKRYSPILHMIGLFQDCGHPETADVIRSYGDKIIFIQQPDLVIHLTVSFKTSSTEVNVFQPFPSRRSS